MTNAEYETERAAILARSDYARENARGAQHAADVIDLIHQQDNPTYLGKIVQRMMAKGEFGGFEVGFFHHLSTRLT